MEPESSSNVSRLHAFTLGDWLVDPKACRISRGGTVLKLRPQLLDLLVCLARHAGQIALKEEILAEVWPGQYVAESGLSRCIAELRQVLQDDAQQPRYIETITKRGYRMAAPVVWLADQDGAARGPLAEPEEGTAAHAVASMPAVTEGRRTDRPWPGRLGRWAAAGVLLLVAGSVAIAMLVRAPAGVLTERDTVLLADMKNSTGDPVFDDTLRLALALHLEQAPFLHILPQDAVRAAVARTGRSPDERLVQPLALEVCRREGAAVLLAGSITPLGSRYAIGIEAIACESGDAIARALVEADSKERVLPALEQAATRIREKLGESRESLRQHDVPLEQATTASLEALKALTLGDKTRDQGRLAEAMTLYRQATDLDPEFALAWARRGATARNLGMPDDILPAFRRAYELRDRVSPPERFYIEAHYVFEEDPEKALEIYQAWRRMYPGSFVARNNLAALLQGLTGQYDAALPEAREAVRLGHGAAVAYRNLIGACLGAGRLDEARQAVGEATRRNPDDRFLHRLVLYVALLDGDRATLERESRPDSADPLLALRLRASDATAGGRLREARRLWSTGVERASEIGDPSRVAEMRRYQAEAEALLGDGRLAREAIQQAMTADRRPLTLPSTAIVFALVGDPVRARTILDDLGPQPAGDIGSFRRVSLPSARALVEAVQGHGDKAIELLRPVTRFARGSDWPLVPLGVWGLVEKHAGRPANAVPVFRDLIQLRGIDPASPWVAFARLGLARALGDSGDVAGSLAAYDAFLESWKDADPDAPLLTAARRERAAVAAR